MWFLMDIAEKLERPALIEKAARICLEILEYSWDKEYGGIFYFMDAKNAPLQQLEWDQKLWWVHQETLIALSKAYLHTARKDVWAWFERVHQYAWQHFPDPENGEWFAYLNRAGKPHLTLKGGKWKGCFHTPRALYECWQNFEKLTKQNQA
jgi:N-acylglucosamine 2-epimerase